MVRYSVEPENPEKVSKSRGSHLRVHFKHCREIAFHTSGMNANKAVHFSMMSLLTSLSFPLSVSRVVLDARHKPSNPRYQEAKEDGLSRLLPCTRIS